MSLHSQVQGLYSAQNQKTVHRTANCATCILNEIEPLSQLFVVEHQGAHADQHRSVVDGDRPALPGGADTLERLAARTTGGVVFTVAPRTAFLMTFWGLGKLFPRADRSPVMEPHAYRTLSRDLSGELARIGRVSRGFYISECLEYAA